MIDLKKENEETRRIVNSIESFGELLEAAKFVANKMFLHGVGNHLPQGQVSTECYERLSKAIAKLEPR